MLIDIGANLTNARFDRDRDSVIQRAIAQGVSRMILTGTSLSASLSALALAELYPNTLFSTAGVHPHDAARASQNDLDRLKSMALLPLVVAVGECGLDYNRNFSPVEIQKEVFRAQVAWACEYKKPLFLHERDAHVDFVSILDSFGAALPPSVVHCFTGTQTELEAYLERGYFIGITGWVCDERRGAELKAMVSQIPLDRLMIETDCPYLTPRDMRPKPKGGRNEPVFLNHICETLAVCFDMAPEALAKATTNTASSFFNLP